MKRSVLGNFQRHSRLHMGRQNNTGQEPRALECMNANTNALRGDEGSSGSHPEGHYDSWNSGPYLNFPCIRSAELMSVAWYQLPKPKTLWKLALG